MKTINQMEKELTEELISLYDENGNLPSWNEKRVIEINGIFKFINKYIGLENEI